MSRILDLRCDMEDVELQELLEFFERRRYVARALVPAGYERYFQDRARFLSAHTSTAIEGNTLDSKVAQLVLIHRRVEDPEELETRNTGDAYSFLADLAVDPSLQIDQGLIRAFNSILLKGLPGRAAQERGRFRVRGCLIIDPHSGEIRYTAPPPEWLRNLMDSFVAGIAEWRENDHPLVASAKAHFGLISIHPFEDGNGRTARLLADLMLQMTGMAADGMLSVSSVLLRDRDDYYESLRSAQGPDFLEQVDITDFVRFHTRSLTNAATALEEQAVAFNMRKDRLLSESSDVLDARQVIGLMYMLDLGPLSTSTYSVLNDCSLPTARSDLKQLVDDGVVLRSGRGKATRYVARSSLFGEDSEVSTGGIGKSEGGG